jgi:hypothetical protein
VIVSRMDDKDPVERCLLWTPRRIFGQKPTEGWPVVRKAFSDMAAPRPFKRLSAQWPATKSSSDPLDEFLPESETEAVPQPSRPFQIREFQNKRDTDAASGPSEAGPNGTRLLSAAAIVVGVLVGLVMAAFAALSDSGGGAPAALTATSAPVVISDSTVTFTSSPSGASVYIDGKLAGQTPVSMRIPVGTHVAELRSGNATRSGSLTVEAGKIATQHVDFGASQAVGGLQISSDPTGAQVAIDGVLKGVTPLKVPEISPGAHRVTVSSGRTSVDRTVEVMAGSVATVVVSVPVVAPTGFVEIDAPMDLEVFEDGRHLGSGRSLRFSLPAGRHTLDVVNRTFSFRTQTTVTVAGGRTVAVNIPMPSGTLSINALPWAEVWVDGKNIGQTPIGNLTVSLGTHEVIWRHPEHGERRQLVLVNGPDPVRLGIDWTR